jgi:hypothetical protein
MAAVLGRQSGSSAQDRKPWSSLQKFSSELMVRTRNAIAVASSGRNGQVRFMGDVNSSVESMRRPVKRTAKGGPRHISVMKQDRPANACTVSLFPWASLAPRWPPIVVKNTFMLQQSRIFPRKTAWGTRHIRRLQEQKFEPFAPFERDGRNCENHVGSFSPRRWRWAGFIGPSSDKRIIRMSVAQVARLSEGAS